jgi:hypothetical protein
VKLPHISLVPTLLALIALLLTANLLVAIRIMVHMPPTGAEIRRAIAARDTTIRHRLPVIDVRTLHNGSVTVDGGRVTVDGSVELEGGHVSIDQ